VEVLLHQIATTKGVIRLAGRYIPDADFMDERFDFMDELKRSIEEARKRHRPR
jgi:hypothetical protein